MNTFPVVEQLDLIEDRHPGVVPADEVAVMHQLVLQVGEESLGHRVVIGALLAVQAGSNTGSVQSVAIGARRVRCAPVGVMDQPRPWPTWVKRQVKCREDQRLTRLTLHRPPDDPARTEIQQHRQMQPTLARADEGHVTDPGPVRDRNAELPVEQIGRGGGRVMVLGDDAEAPLALGFDPGLAPESGVRPKPIAMESPSIQKASSPG